MPSNKQITLQKVPKAEGTKTSLAYENNTKVPLLNYNCHAENRYP